MAMIPMRHALVLAGTLSTLLAPVHAWAGPELELDVERIESSVLIENRVFHPPQEHIRRDEFAPVSGNCVLDPSEACVGGPGIRRLLRFDALIHNRGDEDLVLGNPEDLPELFEFSECHGHFHFAQASIYELLDDDGMLVAPGRKQGFCLEDTTPSSRSTRMGRRYYCENQGLQVGWADHYPREIDCQWIDVTDVPPGDYTLRVHWNPQGLLEDDDMTNNEGLVAVTLEAPVSEAPEVSRIWRPSGFASYATGRAMFIQWSAKDDVAIISQEVWFSLDDGETWEQLVGDLEGDQRWYVWTIPPGAATARARVRVVARDGEVQRGEQTSAPFRVSNSRRLSIRRR
ncbi:MAG: lysyl oxidase family protein [Candidatus Binatia bacterium]|nr:lysyl oxidase family protein [Candidatus Binatia bacterium]